MSQSNKSDEFLKAYDAFADAIFRHCYFRISDHDLAKDLAQETFMRAWEHAAKGTEIRHMRAFLYRVAHNLIVDEYRKRQRSTLSLDDLQEQGFNPKEEGGSTIQSAIEMKDVLALLDKVDSKYRDIVVMRYIDELSLKEIAEILGEKENTVSVRIHRALKQVRIFMENHEKRI
jgi:RNA polymerase sigma factor (sigma-70 family)